MIKIIVEIILALLFIWKYKRTLAVVDIFCNVMFENIFNLLLIKKGGYKFGNQREWISSVIGKNLLSGHLTKLGYLINSGLNLIQKDHAIKQIVN